MAWDDATSKSKLETGPVLSESWVERSTTSMNFKAEADPDGWRVRLFSSWQDTLQPLWIAEWDTGPSQVVSGDAVAAYNNGFNNGIAIGINIKH